MADLTDHNMERLSHFREWEHETRARDCTAAEFGTHRAVHESGSSVQVARGFPARSGTVTVGGR